MLIVWDYFGVIAQDAFWYTAERIAAGKGMNKDMQDAQHAADLGVISWDDYTARVAKDIDEPLDEVRRRYQDHDIKESNILAIHSLPEHTHVLLSNASAGYLLPIMQRLGLDNLFAHIFVSSDIRLAKPDPRAFELVLTTMNTPADQAVMIDDSARNISAAEALGMKGILFDGSKNILSEIRKLSS
jgi:HAD superfamily hydrolase (TIGR01509 family)